MLLALGLGWYGSANNAKTMEDEITDDAAALAQGTIHAVNTRVSGRDIIVSGIANSEAERDSILAAMNGVDGRRVVRDDLRVLDTVSPFALNAAKTADGMTYSGVISTEVDRAVLVSRIGDQAGGLELAAGVPDANWIGAVGNGLDALDGLPDGTLSVSDKVISLKGIALTPLVEAQAKDALEALSEGYTTDVAITTLDDGLPLNLVDDKGADASVSATGKLPAGLNLADLGGAYGEDLSGDVQQSVLEAANTDWGGVAIQGATALNLLKTGQLRVGAESPTLSGLATPSAKSEAEALIAALPASMNAVSDITLFDDGVPFS